MDAEDAAFVNAIREAPDDETARLVYADWLDDRADPRAEYLRTEAAWVALQPSDEQYRPLHRRLSQLAAALDPEWFAAVSRMGHIARREWARVATAWESCSPVRMIEPISEFSAARAELAATFSHYVGQQAVALRFCVPADYLAFLLAVGGNWERDEGWSDLFSASSVAEYAAESGTTFGDNTGEHLEMWVRVARVGDMHHHFLCCDLGCPRFGEVAEGEDYHPWMDSGSAALRTWGGTFLRFLTEHWQEEQD